jgi:hypothetical protein
MNKRIFKPRLLGRQIWCFDCVDRRPPIIKKADFLILVRTGQYELLPSADIDNRVVGICKECLKDRNKFQQSNTQAVDINHENLVDTIV